MQSKSIRLKHHSSEVYMSYQKHNGRPLLTFINTNNHHGDGEPEVVVTQLSGDAASEYIKFMAALEA